MSDEEVLMREINDAEAALAEIVKYGGCLCLIDPTETLGDRLRHLWLFHQLEILSLTRPRHSAPIFGMPPPPTEGTVQ